MRIVFLEILLLMCIVTYAFEADFRFRSTESYVSNGGIFADGAVYPVTRSSVTFGWDSTFQDNDRDRNTTKGTFNGTLFISQSNIRGKFVIDLPQAGQYRLNVFLCDPSNTQANMKCVILDNETPLDSVKIANITPITIGVDTFVDINSNKIAFADTNNSNHRVYNFSSTKCVVWLANLAGYSGTTTISRIMIDDNIPVCDTITDLGFIDSTDRSLTFTHKVGCDGMDSTGTIYGYDTLDLDTVWHIGPFNSGDIINDTILFDPSSQGWFKVISDSLFESDWYSAWTLDDTDSLIIDTTPVCVVPVIDSLSDDTVTIGDNVTIYGLLDDSCTVTINNVEQTITTRGTDSCIITTSGTAGDYNLIFTDTCGSDTISITLEGVRPVIDSIIGPDSCKIGDTIIVARQVDGVHSYYIDDSLMTIVGYNDTLDSVLINNIPNGLRNLILENLSELRDSIPITVYTPITFTDQPDPDTLLSGQAYTASVTATGADSFHYQWIFNGENYGSDTNVLVTSALDTSYDSSTVSCKVWSVGGDTATSNTVIIRVYMLHTIDSVGIYNGVYLKMDSLYTIDSVYVDDEKASTPVQDDVSLQFVPPSAMLWSRNKYTIRMFHRWGYTDYLLSFIEAGTLKTRIDISAGIRL